MLQRPFLEVGINTQENQYLAFTVSLINHRGQPVWWCVFCNVPQGTGSTEHMLTSQLPLPFGRNAFK